MWDDEWQLSTYDLTFYVQNLFKESSTIYIYDTKKTLVVEILPLTEGMAPYIPQNLYC